MKRKLIDGAKFEVVVRSRRGTNEILTESMIDLRTDLLTGCSRSKLWSGDGLVAYGCPDYCRGF